MSLAKTQSEITTLRERIASTTDEVKQLTAVYKKTNDTDLKKQIDILNRQIATWTSILQMLRSREARLLQRQKSDQPS